MTTSPAPAPGPLPFLLLFLSITTGMVDAVSVLGLGKVFTANMTGNVVFLGFAAAGTPGFVVMPHLVAFASFLVGALFGGRTGSRKQAPSLRRFLIVAALVEACLLWIAAVVAIRFDIPTQSPTVSVYAIIALTALAMGYRNATVRRLKVPDLTTTVLTLTLTGLAADSRMAGGGNTNWARRGGSVIAIFLGAALGAMLVIHGGLALPLFIVGAMILGGTLACASHPATKVPLANG